MCTSDLLQMTISVLRDPLLFQNLIVSQLLCKDLLDELLCQIVVLMSAKKGSASDDTCSWSDKHSNELLHEITTQLSDEEHEDKMNANELPATLL